MKKKSLFQLNEKVLRSSFKINFGVRTARVFKLKKNLPYDLLCCVKENQPAAAYRCFICPFFFLSKQIFCYKCFVTLFCKTYKVGSWYTHGQRVDLLCTPNTSSQNILVPLVFFIFFPSLQSAKIKNLLLQNCFNIPLMATAKGMWALLTPCYIFFIS